MAPVYTKCLGPRGTADEPLSACGRSHCRPLAGTRGSVDSTPCRAATARERVLPQALVFMAVHRRFLLVFPTGDSE